MQLLYSLHKMSRYLKYTDMQILCSLKYAQMNLLGSERICHWNCLQTAGCIGHWWRQKL